MNSAYKNPFRKTMERVCVSIVTAFLLAGCASTPEKRAADEQRRLAAEQRKIDEDQRRIDEEQKRWQQSFARYSDAELLYKYETLKTDVNNGNLGIGILLQQGNGIGVLIAKGEVEKKQRERDAVGLELIRRGAAASEIPPKTKPDGNDNAQIAASGSGFFITEDGYLLTNFHVVERAQAVKVKYRGQLYDAEVVRKDKGADLAILKVSGKFKPLPLADSRNVKLGEKVFALGFPKVTIQGEEPKFTDGSISSLYGLHDDSAAFQISVPIQPGNSGGPLVNTSGQVVGIIVAKLRDGENVNYAIKSSRARLLSDDVPEIRLTMTEAGILLTSEEVAERLANSTALLLIY